MQAKEDDNFKPLQAGYRLLFARNPLPMLVVNLASQRVIDANQSAADCYGYPVDQLTEMHLSDLHFAEDHARLAECMACGPLEFANPLKWRHRGADGHAIEVEISAEDLDLRGVRVRMLLVRDVTAQHQDSRSLQQERERLNAIVNASSDAIITVNMEGLIETFNPGAERVFGISRSEMLGQRLDRLLPERFREAHAGQKRRFANSNDAPRMMGLRRVKGLRSDGTEIDLEGSIAQVSIGPGKVLIATLRDVTERDRVEAERQAARAQLSHLAQRLMSQEKDLVKRMAQTLHDQLGQTTAAIRIVHETMGVLRRGKVPREYLRLDQQLGKLIDQATRQIRMVLVELHPPLLDEQGLAAALDNELRGRALAHESMNFVLHAPPEVAELRWPSAVEYTAFMVAREAIENALRHAKASQLTVTLAGTMDHLHLDLVDNGRGIEPGAKVKTGHLGIAGMLERAHSVGATLSLLRTAAGGTQVSLRWRLTT